MVSFWKYQVKSVFLKKKDEFEEGKKIREQWIFKIIKLIEGMRK